MVIMQTIAIIDSIEVLTINELSSDTLLTIRVEYTSILYSSKECIKKNIGINTFEVLSSNMNKDYISKLLKKDIKCDIVIVPQAIEKEIDMFNHVDKLIKALKDDKVLVDHKNDLAYYMSNSKVYMSDTMHTKNIWIDLENVVSAIKLSDINDWSIHDK